MTGTVTHRLVGYGRQSELLATAHEIPRRSFEAVRRIASIEPGDPEALGSYPLTRQQAQEISDLIGERIDLDRQDFFIEPFDEHGEAGADRVARARLLSLLPAADTAIRFDFGSGGHEPSPPLRGRAPRRMVS